MNTENLDRIPIPFRDRVRALVTAARDATIARCSADDLELAVQEAERAALAPFMAIADEADAAARENFENSRILDLGDSDATERADEARAAVWARRMAERDAVAATVDAGPTLHIRGPASLGMVVRAVVAFLQANVTVLPADLVLRAIQLLAATLPDGPLARVTDEQLAPATLRTVAALLRTVPTDYPKIQLGSEALHVLRSMPGASTWTQPYPMREAVPTEMLDGVEVMIDGLLLSAARRRPATEEERESGLRGESLLRRTGGAS